MPAKLRAPQLFCLSALAIVGLLSGCGNKQTSLPAQPAVVHGPRLTVQLQTVDDLKPVSAVITSRDQGLAKARISGTLVRLAVKEGDLVRQGQVIGQIKDERLVYQTQALEAQTRAAAAEVARAEADLARIQTLYNSGIYAKARLDQTEAAAKSAQANLTAARAQSAAGAELNRQGAILAPATGKVLHAEIPVGTVIMAGQTVVEVTAGPMVVRIELPEAQAASLKPGGVVMLAPQDAAPIQASILQVYPSVTDGQVRADLLTITDAANASAILSTLDDDDLKFIAQKFELMAKEIRPKYKLGINQQQFEMFLKSYIQNEDRFPVAGRETAALTWRRPFVE